MNKILRQGAYVAAVSLAGFSAAARADTGSERLDAQVAQLQQQIGARHQLEADLIRNELAMGYSVPEINATQGDTMQAKADDDAFTLAMVHLQKTMTMFAMLDQ